LPINLVNFSPGTQYTNSVYLDSNLLIYCRNRNSSKYREAVTVLGNLIRQQVNLCVSNLVIDELWCVLLRGWHRAHTGNNLTVGRFKRNPAIIQNYKYLIERTTDKILHLPNIQIVASPVNKQKFVKKVMTTLFSENLTPRDGFHLGHTIANNIQGFVTSDGDFDSLNLQGYNLTVFKY